MIYRWVVGTVLGWCARLRCGDEIRKLLTSLFEVQHGRTRFGKLMFHGIVR